MKLRNLQWQLASSICLVLIPACSINFIHSTHDSTPAASASELFPRRTQTELKGSRLVTFQEATEPSQHSPRPASIFTGVAYAQVDARLRKLVERLDTKTLVGQTLMVGYDCYECGATFEETVEAINEGLKDLVREYKIGGVILFKRNFPPQFGLSDDIVSQYVANLTESLQNTAADLVFGVMEHAHIEVLKRVSESLEEQDKTKIIVLVFLEPYFIPNSLYKRRNTIFLSVASLPSMQTVRKVLYGRLAPHPVSHLTVSIPGEVDRKAYVGAPIQPLGQVDESYWQRLVSGLKTGFWQDLLSTLLGSLLGGFLLFIVPRGTLRWTIRAKHQYDLVELKCSLGFSVLIGLFVFLLIPFLESIDIGFVKLTNLGSVPSFVVALAAAVLLGAVWLKMIARRVT